MALSPAQFLTFVRNVMGVPAAYLPDASLFLTYAYQSALAVVNIDLAVSDTWMPPFPTPPPPDQIAWTPYEQAVYNLAGHYLVEFAPDQSYALSALSWSAGMATAVTASAHAIQPGDRLSVAGVSPLGYSGPPNLGYVVAQAVPDNTHFSYGISPNPGTATLLAGASAREQYFFNARKQLKISSFAPGVVTSASDGGTSTGLLNPEFMRNLTLENLQLLKTQYGRTYLSIAQKYGPTAWGLS